MLVFPCRHDVAGSYDVMTFHDPVTGWQRTVRPDGNVVKWRQVRLFWEEEDGKSKTWAWVSADAAESEGGAAQASLSSEVCHFEQHINKHN